MGRAIFWLLAGPNGSGKSTFASSTAFDALSMTPESEVTLQRLNPDERARKLRVAFPHLKEDELALRAAQESDAALDACIRELRSVMVESVLSSPKLKPRVEAALVAGMDFRLTFVVLRHPDLNIARVGHGVNLAVTALKRGAFARAG